MSTLVHQEPLCCYTSRFVRGASQFHRGGTNLPCRPSCLLSSSRLLTTLEPGSLLAVEHLSSIPFASFSSALLSCFPTHDMSSLASSRRIKSRLGSRKRTDSSFYSAFNSQSNNSSKTRRYLCICIFRLRIRKRRGLVGRLYPMSPYMHVYAHQSSLRHCLFGTTTLRTSSRHL